MKFNKYILLLFVALTSMWACHVPRSFERKPDMTLPEQYVLGSPQHDDSLPSWKAFYKDSYLIALIDSALNRNQELNIFMQELAIAKNEVFSKSGSYKPFVGIGGIGGMDKVGRYTSRGASDANNDILPGKKVPDNLSDLRIGLDMVWEVDIWKRLRNMRNAALQRYLATKEGRNFMVTQLVAEIARSYYELMALDNQLVILKQNIAIQQNALEIVKLEKISAKVTELAVRKFETEVLKNRSHQYYLMQQIIETENRLKYLTGSWNQTIVRRSEGFLDSTMLIQVSAGIPSNLLFNRPDLMAVTYKLNATGLNVKSTRAAFYPSLVIQAGMGLNAFSPKYLLQSPQSMIYNLAGGFVGPVLNRRAITADFLNANHRQIQAAYEFDQKLLNAYLEVSTTLSNIQNLKQSYQLKQEQVRALTESIDISTILFRSARADYMEVLMTQRDALESRFELLEIRLQQMHALVNLYAGLGGGWR